MGGSELKAASQGDQGGQASEPCPMTNRLEISTDTHSHVGGSELKGGRSKEDKQVDPAL